MYTREEAIAVLQSFVADPDNGEKIIEAIRAIAECRDVFPSVDPRESILAIAQRAIGV